MFDKTKPHAEISPPWRGAHFKQDGRYFTREGHEINPAGESAGSAPQQAAGASVSVSAYETMKQENDRLRARVVELEAQIAEKEPEAPSPQPTDGRLPDAPAKVTFPPLEDIHGIGPITANELRKIGVKTPADLAALDKDTVADIAENHDIHIQPDWVQQAINMVAAASPGTVQQTSEPAPKVESGLTKADLRAWAMRQGETVHWQRIRKAILEHCSSNVTNETDAVSVLIKDGIVSKGEVQR